MNKNSLKFYAIVVITLVFIYAFSVSYTSDSIDNISYVVALAVDVGKDETNLQITFEFMDTSSFSKEGSSDSKTAIIDTVNATSISSAINLLNAYIGKEVNLSHCKVVVFSDKIAKSGIHSEVSELMNNIQVRPTTNIIICKGSAMQYVQNSISNLEKVLTKYYDIFPNSSQYTGYTSNIQIGNFYNYMTTKDAGNVAILGGLNPTLSESDSSNQNSQDSSSSTGESSQGEDSKSSSSEKSSNNQKPDNSDSISKILSGEAPILGERGTENIGLAVLKDGIYKGDLTASDTLCHTLISGEVNSFLLTINNTKEYNYYIDVALYENTSPKVTVKIEDDVPNINIDIKIIGRISNIKNGINYSDVSNDLDLKQISSVVNNSLKQYILDYLKKTTNDFKCDIDNFYNYAKQNYLTIEEWHNYDWASKYEKSKFNVNVDSRVYYSLLNSD